MAANTFISTASTDMASRPATSFQRFTTYSDVRKDTPILFGDSGEFSMMFNSTRNQLVMDGQGVGIDNRTQLSSDRYQTGVHTFGGKLPVLTANTLFSTDNDFVLIGTNAVAGDATNATTTGRGVKLTSHGADGDFTVLRPDSGANRTPWQASWLSQSKLRWEALIVTDSIANSSTSAVLYAGLKLTNADAVATDDDQVYFRAQDSVNSGRWGAIWSIANVDTTTDTGVAIAANTAYYFVIDVDANRIGRFYINGTLVATTTALTTAITWIPFIGVRASGAAASKIIYVVSTAMSMTQS